MTVHKVQSSYGTRPTAVWSHPWHSVASLLRIRQWFKDHPDGVLKVTIWPPQEMTRSQWHEWFVRCLNHKINVKAGERWRNETTDQEIEECRAARELNTPRLAIHYLPPRLKARFAHRLRGRND